MLAETRLLDQLIGRLAKPDLGRDDDMRLIADTVSLMIQSVGVSMHSILRLTETMDMSIKDCFGIARTISEMSINVAYIVASDSEIAKRARAHALQKQYRDLSRSDEIAGFHLGVFSSGRPSVDQVDGLKEALEQFTDAKGKEVRTWSPKSLNDRIEAVQTVCPQAALALTGSKFAIYRHSSELLHGSYFGVIYYWTTPAGKRLNRATFEEHWVHNHLVTVFTAVFFGAIGIIETCAERFNFPELAQASRRLAPLALELVEGIQPEPLSDPQG